MGRAHYSIVELFATIQGEGMWSGRRAVFIRFSGCNLWNGRPEDRVNGSGACSMWCDTSFAKGDVMAPSEILLRADTAWGTSVGGEKMVVFTGGEPTLQLDVDLVQAFRAAGWYTAIETNGTRDVEVLNHLDHVCVSPKRGTIIERATGHELKIVLPGGLNGEGWSHDELRALASDGDFAALYVQPQDAIDPAFVETSHLHRNTGAYAAVQYTANLKACIEFVHANPSWFISLQAHKLMNVR